MLMKFLLWLPLVTLVLPQWHHNMDEARQIAQRDHKHILLNFSGSDWCGPCIRMEKEIFESDVFRTLADKDLVLVNADFPRSRKNQLSPPQQAINDAMADKYNGRGRFPYTLLLDAGGRVLKTWDGFPDESPEAFAAEVQQTMNANR